MTHSSETPPPSQTLRPRLSRYREEGPTLSGKPLTPRRVIMAVVQLVVLFAVLVWLAWNGRPAWRGDRPELSPGHLLEPSPTVGGNAQGTNDISDTNVAGEGR